MEFGVYLIGYLTLTVIHAQDLPFASVSTLNGQSTFVEGDTLELKCSYSPDKVKYVAWYYSCEDGQGDCDYKGIEKILFAHNKMFPSDTNGTNAWRNRAFGTEKRDGYYITLRNVQITDDDLYVCRTSENEWGLDIKTSNSLELEIAVKPSAGVLQHKNNLQTFSQERSNFTCLVDRVKPPESASVVWYLGPTKLSESQELAYPRLNTDQKTYTILSSLRKSFSHEDHGKKLRCEVNWVVENHVKETISSDEGPLTVWYPPRWTGLTHTVYAEVNSDVTMRCHVDSSPPPNNIRWFKKSFGAILHTGDTFTFQKVSKVNFTIYECEADNDVGPPRKFEVNLKESGRPEQPKSRLLPNSTSSIITLEWWIGSDAGHPPLTYSVSQRIKSLQKFNLISDTIRQSGREGEKMNYDVTGLFANTMYEFQIVAKNTRKEKFPDKDDASEASVVEGKTKVEPLIKITETKMDKDSLYIKWDFSHIIQELSRNYEVSLKIKYGKTSDFGGNHKIYPANNTIMVNRGAVTILDTFDVSEDYTVAPVIYENDQLSKATPADALVTKQSSVSLLLLVIIIPVVAIAIVIVLVACLCCRRRGKLKRRRSTGHKRYNGDYMLERDIYEELKVKTKPPKLPSRNNSLNEPMSPMRQSSNITAIQTMYLTQYPRPSESDGGASGEIPPSPRVSSECQPAGREGTDYLVPVNTSMQITVNQNSTPPVVEYEKEKRLENISEEEKAEVEKLLPAPENHYLPMCKD